MTALRQTLLLLLLAVAVLAPGIGEPTGLTGKDEFFLGLRTPMEMMAGDHWLVPFLDEAPRIRKPPLLYWLGRASFELFGPSLVSARSLAVLFAALLVIATAGIGRRLLDARRGLIAGGILLGCLGLHSEGRRFMLDVPVAAFSACAFWAFLVWREKKHWRWLTLTTLLLVAGFLTKGPVVALLAGSGVLALFFSRQASLSEISRHWRALLLHALLFLALALPWFIVVKTLYPAAAALVFADEVESRHFLTLSPEILGGLFNIALPWAFVFVAAAWQQRRQPGTPRLLLLWFLLSLLPFLFLKSFDRYLIGSLVPLSLFLAWALPQLRARWPFRLGLSTALLFGGALAAFTARFALGGWYWLIFPALYLAWAWWNERTLLHTLAAPAIFSLALLAGVFPAIGVNAVPAAVVELGRQRPIVFFHGPQPALLPILSGKPHRLKALTAADVPLLAEQKALIFCEAELAAGLDGIVRSAGFRAVPAGEYQTLASHGSGLRFAHTGATWQDWRQAWQSRQLAALTSRIVWFEIVRP